MSESKLADIIFMNFKAVLSVFVISLMSLSLGGCSYFIKTSEAQRQADRIVADAGLDSKEVKVKYVCTGSVPFVTDNCMTSMAVETDNIETVSKVYEIRPKLPDGASFTLTYKNLYLGDIDPDRTTVAEIDEIYNWTKIKESEQGESIIRLDMDRMTIASSEHIDVNKVCSFIKENYDTDITSRHRFTPKYTSISANQSFARLNFSGLTLEFIEHESFNPFCDIIHRFGGTSFGKESDVMVYFRDPADKNNLPMFDVRVNLEPTNLLTGENPNYDFAGITEWFNEIDLPKEMRVKVSPDRN